MESQVSRRIARLVALVLSAAALASCTSSTAATSTTSIRPQAAGDEYVHEGIDVVLYARAQARADALTQWDDTEIYYQTLLWNALAESATVRIAAGSDASDECVAALQGWIDPLIQEGGDPDADAIPYVILVEAFAKGAYFIAAPDSAERDWLERCIHIFGAVLDDARRP